MDKVNTKIIYKILAFSFLLLPVFARAESIGHKIILYTPYISRSVTPGQTLKYSVEVINRTDEIQNVSFYVSGIPKDWDSKLSVGANTVQEIAIEPKILGSDAKTIQLTMNLPLKIRKGIYHLKLVARASSGLEYSLPLQVNVTKEGVLETNLKVDQSNMEGYANSHFDYDINLKNKTDQKQNYALIADAPPGWDVRFRSSGDYVTSVNVGSNKNKTIFTKITTPPNIKAGTYHIRIHANAGNTSGEATLETVIEGKFGLKLSTPSGRLSAHITAGGTKKLRLLIKNTGSLPLHNINLTDSAPVDWHVDFKSKKVPLLSPGGSTIIDATVKASNKAIAGDYQLQITANTTNTSSKALFRMTVDQTLTWGFIGIFVILLVVGGIAYLFKKYGRR